MALGWFLGPAELARDLLLVPMVKEQESTISPQVGVRILSEWEPISVTYAVAVEWVPATDTGCPLAVEFEWNPAKHTLGSAQLFSTVQSPSSACLSVSWGHTVDSMLYSRG